MRQRLLFILAAVLVISGAFSMASPAAYADTLQTTFTGNGNTIVFPQYGGAIRGQYYPRGYEFSSQPLNVVVNGTVGLAGPIFFDPANHAGIDLLADFLFLSGPVGYTTLDFPGPNLLDAFGPNAVLPLERL
jgi:hypothetical protein